MMAFMSDVDRLNNRRERAMVHSAEMLRVRACAVKQPRLSDIDRLIDHVAWMRLLRLRSYRIPAGHEGGRAGYLRFDGFNGVPPEALAEFPSAWIEAARAGRTPERTGRLGTLLP
jgi:hypothetical protein